MRRWSPCRAPLDDTEVAGGPCRKVAKKRARCGDTDLQPTAAARLEALRRRVAERQEQASKQMSGLATAGDRRRGGECASSNDRDTGHGSRFPTTATSSTPLTIEVTKMQFLPSGGAAMTGSGMATESGGSADHDQRGRQHKVINRVGGHHAHGVDDSTKCLEAGSAASIASTPIAINSAAEVAARYAAWHSNVADGRSHR